MEYSNNIKQLRQLLNTNGKVVQVQGKDKKITEEITCKVKECQKELDTTKDQGEKVRIYEHFFTSVLAVFEGVKSIM